MRIGNKDMVNFGYLGPREVLKKHQNVPYQLALFYILRGCTRSSMTRGRDSINQYVLCGPPLSDSVC